MERTILGIDPGTTTGIAILDIHGKILFATSLRVHDEGEIVKGILPFGKPIIVSCDKRVPSRAVDRISRRFGARLVFPYEDLKKEEKKALVQVRAGNEHEFDALSAAFYAYGRYRGLFAKIDKVLEEKDSGDRADEVKEFLVRHEEINISEALGKILKRHEQKSRELEPKRLHDSQAESIQRLKAELEIMEELIHLAHEENAQLKKEREAIEERLMRKHLGGGDSRLREKEERIIALSARLDEKGQEADAVRDDLKRLKDFISSMRKEHMLVKRIKDFSLETWKKKADLGLDEEILVVEHPDVQNERVMKELSKLRVVITRHLPKVARKFVFINANNLHLEAYADFVFVKRDALEKELSKKDVLSRIIDEYQRERGTR